MGTFCRDITLYYQGEKTDMCSSFGMLVQEPKEQTLVSIFSYLQEYQVCYECGVEGWTTEAIVDYPSLGYKIGACLPNSTNCKYTQFFNPFTSSCDSCNEKYPNCAACNSTQCLLCIEGFYSYPDIYDYAT